MASRPLSIRGACLLSANMHTDARGAFGHVFDIETLPEMGWPTRFTQWSVSHNRAKHTLRGLHFQRAPWEEEKVVRCVRGAIYDVIVDLRPEQPSFKTWEAVELNDALPSALYIPPGVAHGFLTLEDDTEVNYLLPGRYSAEAAAGVRWDDGELCIPWPAAPRHMSDRDRALPELAEVLASGSVLGS